jgi:hypothetical protein
MWNTPQPADLRPILGYPAAPRLQKRSRYFFSRRSSAERRWK